MKYLLTFLLVNILLNATGQTHRQYHIGDSAFCVIVFYIFPYSTSDRQHGLVCAPEDQSVGIRWYNGKYITTGATLDKIFDKPNATRIIQKQGGGPYAATICASFEDSTDCKGWYLPSRTELSHMYINLASKGIGHFATEGYWSSVEAKSSDSTKPQRKAWIVDFFNGKKFTNDKINKNHVRAVKEFRN